MGSRARGGVRRRSGSLTASLSQFTAVGSGSAASPVFSGALDASLQQFTAAGAGSFSSGGGFEDNQLVTVDGSGFGTNSAVLESLIGPSGAIEAGTLGSSIVPRSGWSELFGSNSPQATRISTSRFYSGSRSLNCDGWYPGQDNPTTDWRGRFGLIYDLGATTREVVVDFLVYFDNAGRPIGFGQWKVLRFTQNPDVDDGLGGENIYFSRGGSESGGGWPTLALNTSGGLPADAFDTGDFPVTGGGWHRCRVYFRMPSTPGASDSILRLRFIRMSDNVVTGALDRVNWRPLGSAGNYFRYLILQNFMGNGYANLAHTQSWMDDIAIVKGSGKFPVVADASVWSARTRDEFLPWESWTNTRIIARMNRGGFSSLTGPFYLYHIDAAVSLVNPVSTTGILMVP